jgi:hypothetical protein
LERAGFVPGLRGRQTRRSSHPANSVSIPVKTKNTLGGLGFRFNTLCLACWFVWPLIAVAQTDEIQVYTGELAAPGEFTLTLHNNYTPNGLKAPAISGGVTPNGTLNGVPEWAYGATDWLELGLYLPVYTITRDHHAYTESAKLRALFAIPHADTLKFFYGVNFEYSRNANRWEPSLYSGEIRPIIGGRAGPVDVIVNPILDTAFDGLGNLDFAPAIRVAYNFSPRWAAAIEHYADLGPIRHFVPRHDQKQALFAVIDYNGKPGVEFGIGHGLNSATDRIVIKLMLNWSLNRP